LWQCAAKVIAPYAGELIDPGIADTRERTYVFYFSIQVNICNLVSAQALLSFFIAAYLDIIHFLIFAVFAHTCTFCTSLARRFICTFV